jgi:transcriptional regulator with XRE-family HTH domain
MELDVFLRTVGERIEKVRCIRGLTRKELGVLIGSTEVSANPTINAIETRGQGTQIDTIFKIAQALDVSPGFLLDGGEITISRTERV